MLPLQGYQLKVTICSGFLGMVHSLFMPLLRVLLTDLAKPSTCLLLFYSGFLTRIDTRRQDRNNMVYSNMYSCSNCPNIITVLPSTWSEISQVTFYLLILHLSDIHLIPLNCQSVVSHFISDS